MIDTSDAALDRWRTVADEPADRAVAGYFEVVDEAPPGALFGALASHLRLPPEDQVPSIAEFLAEASRLPDWADAGRLAAGQQFFARWALHQFTALYLASLPSAYAAAKGVHVLWLTARLQDDAERRLNETAQFLMDVTAPSGFTPGHPASDRVLHVRLMHAAVRWLIDHDPAVAQEPDAGGAVPGRMDRGGGSRRLLRRPAPRGDPSRVTDHGRQVAPERRRRRRGPSRLWLRPADGGPSRCAPRWRSAAAIWLQRASARARRSATSRRRVGPHT